MCTQPPCKLCARDGGQSNKTRLVQRPARGAASSPIPAWRGPHKASAGGGSARHASSGARHEDKEGDGATGPGQMCSVSSLRQLPCLLWVTCHYSICRHCPALLFRLGVSQEKVLGSFRGSGWQRDTLGGEINQIPAHRPAGVPQKSGAAEGWGQRPQEWWGKGVQVRRAEEAHVNVWRAFPRSM